VQVFDNIPGIITYQYINSAYFIVAFLLKIAFFVFIDRKGPRWQCPTRWVEAETWSQNNDDGDQGRRNCKKAILTSV